LEPFKKRWITHALKVAAMPKIAAEKNGAAGTTGRNAAAPIVHIKAGTQGRNEGLEHGLTLRRSGYLRPQNILPSEAPGKQIWNAAGASFLVRGLAQSSVAAMLLVTFLQWRFAVRWPLLADAILMAEAVFVLLRFHVPKLCLGETHVPLLLLSKRRKTASPCGDNPLCTPLVVATRLR
jgi:hypothetical protein